LGERVHTANYHRLHGTPLFDVDGTGMRAHYTGARGAPERPDREALVYWRATELGRAVKLLEWIPLRTVL
jgi:hypothetical protein